MKLYRREATCSINNKIVYSEEIKEYNKSYGKCNGRIYRLKTRFDKSRVNRQWALRHTLLGGECFDAIKCLRIDAERKVWWNEGEQAKKVARMYSNGKNTSESPEMAFKYFRLAAHKGDVEALKKVGKMFLKGYGVEPSIKMAFKYYQAAAILKDVEAQKIVAYMYSKGIGVEPSNKMALKYYKAAACQGDEEAQKIAEEMYLKGFGGKRSYLKGLKTAAYKGDGEAQKIAAKMYLKGMSLNGIRVKQSYYLAFKYKKAAKKQLQEIRFKECKIAAEKGDVEEQNKVAKIFKRSFRKPIDILGSFDI